ncbi:unnamed protein product, partial [Medioppia subpectinata]
KTLIFLISLFTFVYCRQECVARDYGHGSVVCVCNQKQCDDLDPLQKTPKGVVTVFETSKSGLRFDKKELKFGDNLGFKANKSQTITVDKSKGVYQKIIGFGGAFTDAAGLNIKSLPEDLQKRVISDYYGKSGIEYNLGRIPIGGSDFSTHAYSYDDNYTTDYDFKHFTLAKEDFDYKLSYLKAAKAVNPDVKYFGSPWAPPAWLKTNGKLNNGGYLKGQPGGKEYKAFAHYIVKFLDNYKAQGVPMWGITVENEPKAGNDPNYKFNCLGFTPELQRDFLKLDLGPILEASGYGLNTTELMIFDDQRSQIYNWAKTILTDKEAAKYVSGVAFHWYENTVDNIVNLDKAHGVDPSKFILNTEACEEWRGRDKHIYLGHWDTFERYANDIIVDLNHWTAGWVDWNLALDEEGGPNWVKNFVDAPIIVNATNKEYYKQPFFYALGHYSKFLTPGSQRVYQSHDQSVD